LLYLLDTFVKSADKMLHKMETYGIDNYPKLPLAFAQPLKYKPYIIIHLLAGQSRKKGQIIAFLTVLV